MRLTPREKDKLLVSMAAMVSRGRLQRGVKLNYPEAVALITDFVVEGARDGRSVAVARARRPSGGRCAKRRSRSRILHRFSRVPLRPAWPVARSAAFQCQTLPEVG